MVAVGFLFHESILAGGLILEADGLDDVLSFGIRGNTDGGEQLAVSGIVTRVSYSFVAAVCFLHGLIGDILGFVGRSGVQLISVFVPDFKFQIVIWNFLVRRQIIAHAIVNVFLAVGDADVVIRNGEPVGGSLLLTAARSIADRPGGDMTRGAGIVHINRGHFRALGRGSPNFIHVR